MPDSPSFLCGPSATLPIVTRLPNGTVELHWYNGGNNCLQPGLNATYYNVGLQHVTTVNGTVWNRLLQWTQPDNTTFSEYQLSYVVDEWRGPRNTTFFINSSTCYDFNWRAFQALYGTQGICVFVHDLRCSLFVFVVWNRQISAHS